MKKIMSGFVLVFPYVFILLAYLITRLENSFFLLGLMSLILIVGYLISYGFTLKEIALKWSLKTSFLYNLVLKSLYLPIHLLLLLIMGGMGNPFLFLFMGIPFGVSCMLMGVTGVFATIVFVKGRKLGYSVGRVVLYSVLSYCYIADLVVAVIGYRDSLKCENCKQKDFERE